MKACILAGGKGTRLAPLTFVVPKPLIPLGHRPILDIIIRQLANCGIQDITLCLGYLGELIEAYFKSSNHESLGVTLHYVTEQHPLGTAGALALVPGIADSLLVVNGDILTALDYRQLIDYHRRRKNVLTIATRAIRRSIDFGVLHLDPDDRVTAYLEKPQQEHLVSMGIYVYEPAALNCIKAGSAMDVPELVNVLLGDKLRVGAYRSESAWYDIGNPQDYREAAEIFEATPDAFMPPQAK